MSQQNDEFDDVDIDDVEEDLPEDIDEYEDSDGSEYHHIPDGDEEVDIDSVPDDEDDFKELIKHLQGEDSSEDGEESDDESEDDEEYDDL